MSADQVELTTMFKKKVELTTDQEQPPRFEIKEKARKTWSSSRETSVQLHPTQPWIMASANPGLIYIWNFQTNAMLKSDLKLQVRSAKFIGTCIVGGIYDTDIGVYDCIKDMSLVRKVKAHTKTIRCIAVHPTLPFVLSSADDTLIKLWDLEHEWTYESFVGHSEPVMHVTFSLKDPYIFASASHDCTIRIWNFKCGKLNIFTVNTDSIVTCVDFSTGGNEPYLITCSDDNTAKVWNYHTGTLFQTLTGRVSAVCFHLELPIIITGSEDGDVCIWDSTTYRLENTLNYDLGRVWAIGCMKGSRRVVIGFDEGIIMVKIGRAEPAACMDDCGKVIWAKHYKIQTADISVGSKNEISDGERLDLAVEELDTCDLYPQSLKHNPNGQLVVCGCGKYIISTDLERENSFGSALEIVWSPDGKYAARESTSRITIFSKDFQEKNSIEPKFSVERIYGGYLLAMCSNDFICFYDWAECRLIQRFDVTVKNLYWAKRGDQVAIASNTSFSVLKFKQHVVSAYLESEGTADEIKDAFEILCKIDERVRTGIWVEEIFIYNNSSWRLNYCVGGKVTTMFHLDRPMYLLGYLANQSSVYLIDRDCNVIRYKLLLSLVRFRTHVMSGDLENASHIVHLIPKEQLNSVARFLELRGMIEAASQFATDRDYKFELETQLGKLKMAKEKKNIVWVIDVKYKVKGRDRVRQASGFLVKGDVPLGEGREFVILTCAEIFEITDPVSEILVRRLDENGLRRAKVEYMDRRLNLAALRVSDCGSDHGSDYGVLAGDGSIFPGECLFYVGNPDSYVGSHLVGEACSSCTNNVFRVMGCDCSDYRSDSRDETPDFKVIGDLYDLVYFHRLKTKRKMYRKNNQKPEKMFKKELKNRKKMCVLDALLPIIQIGGLLDREGMLGGPVLNSRGEIVGILVSSFKNFQIAIHVRAIETFFQLLGAYYFEVRLLIFTILRSNSIFRLVALNLLSTFFFVSHLSCFCFVWTTTLPINITM